MKTVAIAQARMGSTRLPGKVLKTLGNKPLLRWTIDALNAVSSLDEVVLATSKLPADDEIVTYCARHGITFFRGSESDVLDRFYQCAKKHKADIVIRVTCDCPFLDPNIIAQVIKLREMTNADYASCCYPPTFADGIDTECFTFHALEIAWKEAVSKIDRECQTQFIVRNRNRFKVVNLTNPLPNGYNEHWVCDSAEDFQFCKEIAKRLPRTPPSYVDILDILDKEPELRKINAKSIRNERFYEGLAQEELPPRTFERSRRIFERASKSIPTGAQTFSKSHLQFPRGNTPLYCSHGDGGYIFDVDGNRFVDLVGALGPVVLGYNDVDVDEAIRRQLDNGITLSLSTELESELAELLCKHIPCAEMVRFGKSGTDATTAAVRLARAYTKRDYVLVGGYHGWSDWSLSLTDRNHGIPKDVKKFTQRLPYGVHFDTYPGDDVAKDAAAIIVEPNDDPEYLQHLREICSKFGIVLIFDEIITGFRYGLGGAQELYGVTPDLACFGKAMANGMPISALVGKRDIMKLMETPDVFFSGTFFGETLSIAAAITTINKIEKEGVMDYLCKTGAILERNILLALRMHGLDKIISIDGWYPNQKLKFVDDKIRSIFMQEMAKNGVLIINSNMLSFAHKEPEIKRIVKAYDNTFRAIALAISNGSINDVEPVAATPLRATA